jgi:transposase InsO family protein
MRMQARYEVAAEIRGAYWAASKPERGRLLDHFCAVTGYNRKYAIAVLRGPGRAPSQRRRRAARYGMAVKRVVRVAWEASGWVCAERLKPVLLALAEQLERHGTVDLDDEMRSHLVAISVATLKRMMRVIEIDVCRRRQMTTRPGTLRLEIPVVVGISADAPGLMEIDLVAHCGASGAGEFIFTLCATDVATGWTERIAIIGKSRVAVVGAMETIRKQLPFTLKAIHSDNGSEFLNDLMVKWCRSNDIAFTRSRPYHKNDNAHVEERNWTLVRKLIGYARLETSAQCDWLNALYTDLLRVHNNGVQPIMKLLEKHRIDGRLRKRYDTAATPAQRAFAFGCSPDLARFLKLVKATNPLTLKRRIDRIIAAMPASLEGSSSA